jgi:glutamine amidotransferase-like uncharacterized protein
MKYRKSLILLSLMIILLTSSNSTAIGSSLECCATGTHSVSQTTTDLSGVSVGVFDIGYHDPRVNESRTAIVSMLEWMNATVRSFNKTNIVNGSLFACEVLVIPEGLGPNIEWALKEDGLQAIREWIAAGGSYIGVRGSAAMAVKDSYFEGRWTEFDFAVINGTSYEVTDLSDFVMTNVSINRECTGPDLSNMPANLSVYFRTGRYIIPHEGQELIYIANYTHNNLPAMVASSYGAGNVFISSPHFEFEENSDRDGTDEFDDFDDPDSEWPFILEITKWLIESSPTVQNLTTWPISPTPTTPIPTAASVPIEWVLAGGGLGIVVIAAVVVFIRRK